MPGQTIPLLIGTADQVYRCQRTAPTWARNHIPGDGVGEPNYLPEEPTEVPEEFTAAVTAAPNIVHIYFPSYCGSGREASPVWDVADLAEFTGLPADWGAAVNSAHAEVRAHVGAKAAAKNAQIESIAEAMLSIIESRHDDLAAIALGWQDRRPTFDPMSMYVHPRWDWDHRPDGYRADGPHFVEAIVAGVVHEVRFAQDHSAWAEREAGSALKAMLGHQQDDAQLVAYTIDGIRFNERDRLDFATFRGEQTPRKKLIRLWQRALLDRSLASA